MEAIFPDLIIIMEILSTQAKEVKEVIKVFMIFLFLHGILRHITACLYSVSGSI